MARILVVDPVAKSALELLVAAHETVVWLNLPRDELLSLLVGTPAGMPCCVEESRDFLGTARLGRTAAVLVVPPVGPIGYLLAGGSRSRVRCVSSW